MMRSISRFALMLGLVLAANASVHADIYYQANLVSNVAGKAANLDPNLKNPWGISFSPTGPFWVSNQFGGTSTLYNSVGTPLSLVVTTPGGSAGQAGPTGQVFNNTADFIIPGSTKSSFIFANLNGQISAWNAGQGTLAKTVIDHSSTRASYTGLALGVSAIGSTLYAANNAQNKIDVFNSTFGAGVVAGAFTDPTLSSDFTAFNIQNIGNKLYVTYQSKTGAGGGAVDIYDLNGNLLSSLISNAPGGPLDSPWGIAIAPSTFGQFANALLVGNEDLGTINGYNATTGAFIGTISTFNNAPLINIGLWGLTFGNGGNGGDKNSLYFAAGLPGEFNGLFGVITVPEPSSMILTSLGLAGMVVLSRRFRRR